MNKDWRLENFVIENHQGKIHVESEITIGTTFTIFISKNLRASVPTKIYTEVLEEIVV